MAAPTTKENGIRDDKICDPAIGSGAFPMGLLNELVRCRVFINAWAKDEKGNLLEGDYAALKTEIISNNIYGVDIEKGAIDIARLRFWLSIIVDEQTPHVLPNFDYKFMQGNSLIPTFDGKYINLDTKSQKHINVEAMKNAVGTVTPTSVRAAATIITMLPIICIYPFLQKYFVTGLTLGGVKE